MPKGRSLRIMTVATYWRNKERRRRRRRGREARGLPTDNAAHRGQITHTLLRSRTRCVFFNSLFEHIAVNNCNESSILFVLGSSSRYCTIATVNAQSEMRNENAHQTNNANVNQHAQFHNSQRLKKERLWSGGSDSDDEMI